MEIWEKKIMGFSRKPLQILHSSFIIHHFLYLHFFKRLNSYRSLNSFLCALRDHFGYFFGKLATVSIFSAFFHPFLNPLNSYPKRNGYLGEAY